MGGVGVGGGRAETKAGGASSDLSPAALYITISHDSGLPQSDVRI